MIRKPGVIISKAVLMLLLLLLAAGPAAALTVKGVDLRDEVVVSGRKLILNGAGVRKKFFFSIYACGLYLPHPASDPVKIMQLNAPKQIIMVMIHSKVSQEKIVKAWNNGFFKNSQEKLDQLKERIAAFNAIFARDLVAGDRIEMTYLPDRGTIVKFNRELHDPIPGKDFYDALLAIWLGDNPADSNLKDALLGKD